MELVKGLDNLRIYFDPDNKKREVITPCFIIDAFEGDLYKIEFEDGDIMEVKSRYIRKPTKEEVFMVVMKATYIFAKGYQVDWNKLNLQDYQDIKELTNYLTKVKQEMAEDISEMLEEEKSKFVSEYVYVIARELEIVIGSIDFSDNQLVIGFSEGPLSKDMQERVISLMPTNISEYIQGVEFFEEEQLGIRFWTI